MKPGVGGAQGIGAPTAKERASARGSAQNEETFVPASPTAV